VEAIAQSGFGADQPQPVVKPVRGLKAVTAEAKAPVKSTSSAESQTGIGTPTAALGNNTPQATAISVVRHYLQTSFVRPPPVPTS
jgi:hypothetical protein